MPKSKRLKFDNETYSFYGRTKNKQRAKERAERCKAGGLKVRTVKRKEGYLTYVKRKRR